MKYHTKGSNIANHAWVHDHSIDFDNGMVIDKGTFRNRRTLESWHTAATKEADNNSKLFFSYAYVIKITCYSYLSLTRRRLQTGSGKLVQYIVYGQRAFLS